jgi:RNA polymerase sigma-70 factor (ECF subfamily)
VARRVLATQHRSAQRRGALTTRLAIVTSDRPEAAAPEVSDLELAATDALFRLSEPDREAITLIAWEGLSPAQAAVVLGVSRVAFRARLSRAKRRLRKQLGQEELQPGSQGDADPRLARQLTPPKEEATP